MVFQRCFAFALTAALAAGAVAQERPAAPGAADEKATAPVQLYQSAFADYKSFQEPEVMSWRAANDQVRGVGGMGGHNMSKMDAAPVPAAGKLAIPDKAAGHQKATPEHGHDTMKAGPGAAMEMPGHDMAKMRKTIPTKSAPAAPKAAKKPAIEDPQKRMDHSRMNNKE